MQRVMDNLKDVDTSRLKKLLRNLNNIFPLRIQDVDPTVIREKLFTSLANTTAKKNTKNKI